MSRGQQKRPDGIDSGLTDWGAYFEAKKAKLQDQYEENVKNEVKRESDLFSSVAIYINGLTHPPAEDLKHLMAIHGGTHHVYQSSSTTHIIASNLPNVKINKLGSVPIVKPSWITDSIELNKLLDYKRYLLYSNQSVSQPKLEFPTIQKTKTASDPNFLEEFYNNSRLHLISTLGAEFKQLIADLRDQPERNFPSREKLLQIQSEIPFSGPGSVIMHIDMDCFFVSVGLRNHPELKGKPVAVTHAKNAQLNAHKERREDVTLNLDRFADVDEVIDGRSSMSEIASCSYEARKCGVRNGMFLGAAAKHCPDIKTIPYDFEGYKDVSMTLYKTLTSYTLDIEAVSIDEMYVDVTEILRIFSLSVDDWSAHIRNEIMSATGCPCSTGFGGNRLQARLATKRAKPAGSYHLKSNDVEAYMAEIPLSDIPGVGRVTLHKLKSLGLETCGDVQVMSLDTLHRELGVNSGDTIFKQARGVDKKPLNFHHERKSVSAEINYGIRFKSLDECHKFLESLANEVCNRLIEVKMRTRCITLKLMVRAPDAPVETAKFLGHGLCDNLSKSVTTHPITDPKIIYREAKKLYEKLNPDYAELRGMGIQLSKLEKPAAINPALTKFLQQESSRKVESQQSELKLAVPIGQQETAIKIETAQKQVEDTPGSVVKPSSGRGRPKGSKSIPKNKLKTSIDNFFKSKKDNSANKLLLKKEEVDLDVLNELPEEIRDEIMREYNMETSIVQLKEEPKSQPTSVKEEPLAMPKRSVFDGLSWEQMKPALYHWMETQKTPATVDVEMLGKHFQQLAMERKIEILRVALNFLHRNFSELGCSWHKAYRCIVDFTQQGMIARYGSVIYIRKKFDCC